MFVAIVVLHIVLCVSLMGLVLIQQGKGADAGAIMGGGSDALLGAGSAGNVVSKITTTLAIGFMITSIVLVKFYDKGMASSAGDMLEGSLMSDVESAEPVLPGTVAEPFEGTDSNAAEVIVPDEDQAVEAPAIAAMPGAEQVEDPQPAAEENGEEIAGEAGTTADNVVVK